MHKPMLILAY